ncbi:hypothetical protein JTE90_011266 [Oedothorax gibbosus]|uniref:Uncharacterized protein n=1 Tax=Oedothorax gibbosus TaxID=931172 RepID=A0AAV6TMN8_9ARAC|nr:hypothetical protein JTE90_011266 [Oedothorax gibbosus]
MSGHSNVKRPRDSGDDNDPENDPDEPNNRVTKVFKAIGWFALKTVVVSGAVLGGVAIAVPALGFTSVGVAAGSAAAAYQSAVLGGTIVSGSTFAVLQSVGAAGLAAGTQAGIVAGSAVVSGAHSLMSKMKGK